MSRTLARTYAEFASDLASGDIPAEVRRAAHLHIVDSIGVSIAGAAPDEESGQAARRLAVQWRAHGATLNGLGTQCRAEMAALVNGALAQALEMDDKHGSSLARPGSTVVPAGLAVAEQGERSIGDLIAAVTAGYEVMIRLGFVAEERFLERGYHTSSLIGGFGSVATAGRLVGANPDTMVSAFGIAGTMASGIQESTRTGSTSKIIHGGWGAHSGIIATDMAMAGITGPESVFEGRMGFFQTHLTPIRGELDWARASEGLGSRWYLPETAFKPYPCCQLLHAFIEAVKQIRGRMAADGVAIEATTAIRCKLAEPGLTLVTEPRERKRAPKLRHEARFSLPFVVANAMITGEIGLHSFDEAHMADPAIARLALLVSAAEDPESDYPAHCPARMEVDAAGRTYAAHVPYHPGSPEAALGTDEVLGKFARNTGWLFGAGAREAGEALLDLAEDERAGAISAEVMRRTIASANEWDAS